MQQLLQQQQLVLLVGMLSVELMLLLFRLLMCIFVVSSVQALGSLSQTFS